TNRTYHDYRREMVIANVPVAATVTLAAMVVYILAHVLLHPTALSASLPRYTVQLLVPLLMWWLATGRYAQQVVLGCDLVFTLAISSQLIGASADPGVAALVLSLKMLATPLLIGWEPRVQMISAVTTL